MPAAEPARTGHDSDVAAGAPGGALIIPLAPRTTHGRNGAAAAQRSSGGPAMTQPAPPPGDDSDEAILRPLAEMIERSMVERHLTLADPRTADAVDAALGVAVTVMGGAHAQGMLDDAQREQLAGLLEGARRAARLASGE